MTPEQVLAFRLAAHGLASPFGSVVEAAAGWNVQDSPPGTAAVALQGRVSSLAVGEVERALHEDATLVQVYNPRAAPVLVPASELGAFCAGLRPRDPESLRHVLGSALKDSQRAPEEALELGLAAVREALDGRELTRDELHAELRARLPDDLLPWCRGCESNHARRGLLNAVTLHGALRFAGRAGRQPLFAAGPAVSDGDRGEVVRRFLRWYGPSNVGHFAHWAGVSRSHAGELWELVRDELGEVRAGWLLAADRGRLESPPQASGVRLLPVGDPLLLARDREVLVPDVSHHKAIWVAIGGPGVVLYDGRVVATWRLKKAGRKLAVTVEPFDGLARAPRAAIEDAVAAVAPHRGCTTADVTFA